MAQLSNVPTCVGVYRREASDRRRREKCPHVRGGVPFLGDQFALNAENVRKDFLTGICSIISGISRIALSVSLQT